jgi:hypothetical protein
MAKHRKTRFKHKVRIGQMPELEIVHKDLVITVGSQSSGKLGDLTISRGGICALCPRMEGIESTNEPVQLRQRTTDY